MPELQYSVFVYGTLKDNLTRTMVLGRQIPPKKAKVTGYGIESIIIEGITYPAAMPKDDSELDGFVIDLTPDEIKILDEWETIQYERVIVSLEDKTEAWMYIKNKMF